MENKQIRARYKHDGRWRKGLLNFNQSNMTFVDSKTGEILTTIEYVHVTGITKPNVALQILLFPLKVIGYVFAFFSIIASRGSSGYINTGSDKIKIKTTDGGEHVFGVGKYKGKIRKFLSTKSV